jgi:hypothetical protein
MNTNQPPQKEIINKLSKTFFSTDKNYEITFLFIECNYGEFIVTETQTGKFRRGSFELITRSNKTYLSASAFNDQPFSLSRRYNYLIKT